MSQAVDTPLIIAGKEYNSRLLVGSGKYKDLEETRLATEASGADIITVAIRRTNIGQNPDEPNLLDVVPPSQYTILPNTAGCYNAEDAIRTCRLARELLDGHNLVKLEVLGDENTIRVIIEDNGVGLPQDRERIMEPYVTTRDKGTGLGLAIVNKIVEEHGGEMTFSSAGTGGTRVSISFARDPLVNAGEGAE